MKERKKLKILVVLLVALAGILTWQGLSRERLPQAVDKADQEKALSALDGMLKVGQKSGWDATAPYWVKLPDASTRAEYVRLMGGAEYVYQGSASAQKPADIVLYAGFPSGNQVAVLLSRQNDGFKILSLKNTAD